MSVLRENKTFRLVWASAILFGVLTMASISAESPCFDLSAAKQAVQSWSAPLQFNVLAVAAAPPQ